MRSMSAGYQSEVAGASIRENPAGRERHAGSRPTEAIEEHADSDHAWSKHAFKKGGKSREGRLSAEPRLAAKPEARNRRREPSRRPSCSMEPVQGPAHVLWPCFIPLKQDNMPPHFLTLGAQVGIANRGRRRTGRRYNDRAGGGCTVTLLLVASLGIASQDQRPYESAQDQGHEVSFHGCISLDELADRSGYTAPLIGKVNW